MVSLAHGRVLKGGLLVEPLGPSSLCYLFYSLPWISQSPSADTEGS